MEVGVEKALEESAGSVVLESARSMKLKMQSNGVENSQTVPTLAFLAHLSVPGHLF